MNGPDGGLIADFQVARQAGHFVAALAPDQRAGGLVPVPNAELPSLDGQRQHVFAFAERRLSLLAAADVLDLADEIKRPVIRAAHHRDAQVHPHHQAVLANVAFLRPEPSQRAVLQILQRLACQTQAILGIGDRVKRRCEQFRLRIPQQLAKRPVHLREPPVRLEDFHRDRGIVENAPEARLTLG